MKYNIGFMQGRLSPIQGKKYNLFLGKVGKKNFKLAES